MALCSAAATELGSLPLPLQLIEQALTAEALDLLDPAPNQITFTAVHSNGQAMREELLVAAGEELSVGNPEKLPSEVSLWGHRLAVGEPLQMGVQARLLPPPDSSWFLQA